MVRVSGEESLQDPTTPQASGTPYMLTGLLSSLSKLQPPDCREQLLGVSLSLAQSNQLQAEGYFRVFVYLHNS